MRRLAESPDPEDAHFETNISPPGQVRRCCTVETRYISRQISDRLKVCILCGNNKLLSHNLMQANSVVSQCALLRLQTAVQHAHRRFVAEWNFAVGQYPVFFHTQKILKMLFMNRLWTYFFNLFTVLCTCILGLFSMLNGNEDDDKILSFVIIVPSMTCHHQPAILWELEFYWLLLSTSFDIWALVNS